MFAASKSGGGSPLDGLALYYVVPQWTPGFITGGGSSFGFGVSPNTSQPTVAVDWVVPTGVYYISAVCVGAGGGGGGSVSITSMSGGGGGGGGALAYATFAVTPGETLTITVGIAGRYGQSDSGALSGLDGGFSMIRRGATELVRANGGSGANGATGGAGGTVGVGTGGAGGAGGNGPTGVTPDPTFNFVGGGGGGGAGGYSGAGGAGGNGASASGGGSLGTNGSNGSGGGGGGGGGGYQDTTTAGWGGCVDVFGAGSSGNGGTRSPGTGTNAENGGPGSGGATPTSGNAWIGGGGYGGGAYNDTTVSTGYSGTIGGSGAVRILAGTSRFPTNAPLNSNEVIFSGSGAGTWTVPAGVTSVSVVCVGGGASGLNNDTGANGGAGGGLRYYNNLTVTPGSTINYSVGIYGSPNGSDTWFNGTNTGNASVWAQGGQGQTGGGGSTVGGSIGGGNGGAGGGSNSTTSGGGGGAGGYQSAYSGAAGGSTSGGTAGSGTSQIGGGGGGQGGDTGFSGSGGGVGLYPGCPVSASVQNLPGATTYNNGPSGGSRASQLNIANGAGTYGGGGGGNDATSGGARNGATGAIRVIWPGNIRTFPYAAGK